MKKIKLTNCNDHILVDDNDYERCAREQWKKITIRRSGKTTHRVQSLPIKHDQKFRYSTMNIANFIYGDSNIRPKYIDGDILNNQKDNLRINTVRHAKYKGVYKLPNGKWLAKVVGPAGETYYCGVHEKPIEAARFYNRTAKMLYGVDCTINTTSHEDRKGKRRKPVTGNWAAQIEPTLESRYA